MLTPVFVENFRIPPYFLHHGMDDSTFSKKFKKIVDFLFGNW